MSEGLLHISGNQDTPDVYVHIQPVYALYHYVIHQATQPAPERNAAIAEWAATAEEALHVHGLHGVWDAWEVPLASADSVEEAVSGLRARAAETFDVLESALSLAQPSFREHVWPVRRLAAQAAMSTLRDFLSPPFARMQPMQVSALGLSWPERIDAYLVAESYDRHGAYSHPLTIDVTMHQGLPLCETFVHEAIHVADVHTAHSGAASLRNRLSAQLTERGMPAPAAWNVWHAVIFAASAYQIREIVGPGYIDYATVHGLYDIFGVSDLPHLWTIFASGEIDEPNFLRQLADRACGTTS